MKFLEEISIKISQILIFNIFNIFLNIVKFTGFFFFPFFIYREIIGRDRNIYMIYMCKIRANYIDTTLDNWYILCTFFHFLKVSLK